MVTKTITSRVRTTRRKVGLSCVEEVLHCLNKTTAGIRLMLLRFSFVRFDLIGAFGKEQENFGKWDSSVQKMSA